MLSQQYRISTELLVTVHRNHGILHLPTSKLRPNKKRQLGKKNPQKQNFWTWDTLVDKKFRDFIAPSPAAMLLFFISGSTFSNFWILNSKWPWQTHKFKDTGIFLFVKQTQTIIINHYCQFSSLCNGFGFFAGKHGSTMLGETRLTSESYFHLTHK